MGEGWSKGVGQVDRELPVPLLHLFPAPHRLGAGVDPLVHDLLCMDNRLYHVTGVVPLLQRITIHMKRGEIYIYVYSIYDREKVRVCEIYIYVYIYCTARYKGREK